MLKLSKGSLDWALSHAISGGDTDIFPHAFEFLAIQYNWDTVREFLAKEDVLKWTSRPLRRCLSPKRRYGFRIATQLDPLDFLVYAAIVYEMGENLEKHRVAVAKKSVSSHRFKPTSNGGLFDPNIGYATFQDCSRHLVKTGNYSHVVITDIADFYPRLYLHRVEGALSAATPQMNHVSAVSKLLSQWNQSQSYGIPVGPAPSRLVAEVSIDDVDKTLESEDITFVRYVDDYRLFVKSPEDGYRKLTTLANALFKNHGLTLQQEKTNIITIEDFEGRYSSTEESEELKGLSDKFDEFLDAAGIDDPYGIIDYDSLDDDQRGMIDSLNLEDLLGEQLEKPEIEQRMVRFLLRRLGQLDSKNCVDAVITSIGKLFTVFQSVIEYIGQLRTLDEYERQEIGKRLLALPEETSVYDLDFHRMWLFSLFSQGEQWGNSEQLASLYSSLADHFSRRKLTLALSRSKQDYWFRTRKDDIFEFGGWQRRAFLAGANCLPGDERKHWYRFLGNRLDVLEDSVVKWAQNDALQVKSSSTGLEDSLPF